MVSKLVIHHCRKFAAVDMWACSVFCSKYILFVIVRRHILEYTLRDYKIADLLRRLCVHNIHPTSCSNCVHCYVYTYFQLTVQCSYYTDAILPVLCIY